LSTKKEVDKGSVTAGSFLWDIIPYVPGYWRNVFIWLSGQILCNHSFNLYYQVLQILQELQELMLCSLKQKMASQNLRKL